MPAACGRQSFTILNNTFKGLFRPDTDHAPQPAPAESYTLSDVGPVCTFPLREGLAGAGVTILYELRKGYARED